MTPKGEYIAATVTKTGRKAAEILAELLPKEINAVYWPKNMFWRNPGERFVRPVRWLVAMLDDEIIPLAFDGIKAGSNPEGIASSATPIEIWRQANTLPPCVRRSS